VPLPLERKPTAQIIIIIAFKAQYSMVLSPISSDTFIYGFCKSDLLNAKYFYSLNRYYGGSDWRSIALLFPR